MKVTVVMPAYNAETFIKEAIQSVLGQTLADFQLIVVDDGSTDATGTIVGRFANRDSRIRLVSQENLGVSAALNRGIQLATTDWVAITHADDLMLPKRLERQLAFVRSHANLAVAGTFVLYINDSGDIVGKGKSPYTTCKAVAAAIEKDEPIGLYHPSVILRRSVVLAVGGYRNQFWPAEDIDLWNRIIESGAPILVQPEFLQKYRIHSNAASVSHARLTRLRVSWIKKCIRRRRAGLREIGWQEFLQERKHMPALQRLNTERKDLAKILYKAAACDYASAHYPRFAARFAVASLLQPTYTIKQALSKRFGR